MGQPESPGESGRDTYLAVMICIIVGLPLFVFLSIITFGLPVLLLALAGGIAALAGINYLLWGRHMERDTAWEREEANVLGELYDQEG